MSKDCWLKEENKHKRPSRCKSTGSGEQGTAAADGTGSKVEFLFCSMSIPADQQILNDPNVWIGDAGATVHMTPCKNGIANIRKGSKNDAVTVGNKQVEEATLIADIPGQVCNKNRSQLNRTTMKYVAPVPNGGFNLFSIAKMMSKGWKLIGEKHKLMLKKGSDEINFDIAIPTPKGVTCATHVKRDAEFNGAMTDQKTSIQQAHDKLGHCGKE
jgi:hypothetical protein